MYLYMIAEFNNPMGIHYNIDYYKHIPETM